MAKRRQKNISWQSSMCSPYEDWQNSLCSVDSLTACIFPTFYIAETEKSMAGVDVNTMPWPDQICHNLCISHAFCSAVSWLVPCFGLYHYRAQVRGDKQFAILSLCTYYLQLLCIGRTVFELRRTANAKYKIGESICFSLVLSYCCWPCTLSQTYNRVLNATDVEKPVAYTNQPHTHNSIHDNIMQPTGAGNLNFNVDSDEDDHD